MGTAKAKKIIQSAEKKLLHEHVHGLVRTIEKLKAANATYKEKLSQVLEEEIFTVLVDKVKDREVVEFEKVKDRQKNKFLKLINRQPRFEWGEEPTTSRAALQEDETEDARESHEQTEDAREGQEQAEDEEELEERREEDTTQSSRGIEESSVAAEASANKSPDLKDKWIVNLSGKSLSSIERNVLNKGLNVVPAPRTVNNVDFITEVEKFLEKRELAEDEANKIRFEVTKALQSFRPTADNLTSFERKALNALRQRKDITILPSEKGRSVCVLTVEQYKEKVSELVSDIDTYEKLNKDPTSMFVRKVRECLKAVEMKGYITRAQYLSLYPSDPSPPLFYGLPKVHKPGVPLRPIVSTIGSVTYNLAKYLARLLTPLVGQTDSYVKDSKNFAEFVRNLQIGDDEIMVSFDVKSLFTSIPVEVACEAAEKRLGIEMGKEDSNFRASTGMEVDEIMRLLRLCLNCTYFQLDGEFYKQKRGTAMGSPVSVVVANLFMEEFEQEALKSFPHQVKVWKRYIDDTFVVLKTEHVEGLYRHLNDQFQGVSFTVERESSGILPFLDVEVRRSLDGSLQPFSGNQHIQINI